MYNNLHREAEMIIGYKAFLLSPDGRGLLTNWGPRKKYYPGRTYEIKGKLELCKRGFHYSTDPACCFYFYRLGSNVVVYELEVLGDILSNDYYKSCTNKMKIIAPVEGIFMPCNNWCSTPITSFLNGQFKSFDDRPAFVGKKQIMWCRNGQVHRGFDKPASINFELDAPKDMEAFWRELTVIDGICFCPEIIVGMVIVWYCNGKPSRKKGPTHIHVVKKNIYTTMRLKDYTGRFNLNDDQKYIALTFKK